ncbi:MAG: GPP34 family phosphoprotein [Acidobacteria bacterium]|nr:GPP34 family phosphoprotein [Acidobacteriota bacterium]MXX74234.1 GPP34 family phosphoprotein [Holophagales bacterium]MXZ39566.1 GPP34 family phosphoprotein [Holophagales bacterium]MYA09052.1 GPP34 family phosphoprotein [Holophagales bacterium]MYF04034.1 GPP34 family phosphoprotein [Holophagales bacterium]
MSESPHLTFVEEILLLLLDDDSGAMKRVAPNVMELLLAGAILMDLALRGRLDCDLQRLVVVDPTPVGEEILDGPLAEIAEAADEADARTWVVRLSARSKQVQEAALARLVERGILRVEDRSFLWVFGSRRYPMVDDREEREVKLRILDVLLSDRIPAPRDVALICLADASNAFQVILSAQELRHAAARIELVRGFDLIGQAMGRAIQKSVQDIAAATATAHHPFY